MNKKDKEIRLIELLHSLTQKGYKLTFSNDFEGMITIGWELEYEEGTYTHSHLGIPGTSLKRLESELRICLSSIDERN